MELIITSKGATALTETAGKKIQVTDHARIHELLISDWATISDRNDQPGKIRTFAVTLTRVAAKDVYAAGDCILDVSGAIKKILACAITAGGSVVILNVRAQTNDTGLAGTTLKIHFYNDTITPIADNGVFDVVDDNASKREGSISLTFGPVGSNSAKVAHELFTNLVLNPVGVDIPIQIETVSGFTPSDNSTWIKLYFKCQLGY